MSHFYGISVEQFETISLSKSYVRIFIEFFSVGLSSQQWMILMISAVT